MLPEVKYPTMSFNIERGLFKFEFADHHAVLGLPLDAAAGDIRKRYLKISRRLHPDACASESEDLKQQASQLFAKLVNPAYQELSGEQSRAEHNALLSRIGKRLVQERDKAEFSSEAAKQLSRSNNIDHEYRTQLQKLAENQYEAIDQVPEKIAQISELNLVYLLRKANQGASVAPKPTVAAAAKPATAPKTGTATAPANGRPPVPPKVEKAEPTSMTEPYCRRAEEYIAKNSFAKAILELKDALKMEPNNSRCHSLLAKAYLKENQATMASIHLKQALKLNPKEPTALEVQQVFERIAQRTGGKASSQKKPDKPSGGLFGLFGRKK
jgi:curved DNA-binding protein CbpA